MKFKVGDQVSWCGVPGKVIDDYAYQYADAQNLLVEFDVPDRSSTTKAYIRQAFLYDGRLYPWHKEPSLKLKQAN